MEFFLKLLSFAMSIYLKQSFKEETYSFYFIVTRYSTPDVITSSNHKLRRRVSGSRCLFSLVYLESTPSMVPGTVRAQ